MNKSKNQSPTLQAWKKLQSNKPAMIGLGVILLSTLLAAFAYSVTPDQSIDANQQKVELKLLKPGAEVKVVVQALEHSNVAFRWPWQPAEIDERVIPVAEAWEGNNLISYIPLHSSDTFSISSTPDVEITSKRYWLGTDALGRDYLSRLLVGSKVSIVVGFIAVAISLFIGLVVGSLAGFFGGWVDSLVLYIINIFWSIPTLLLALCIALVFQGGLQTVCLAIGFTMWIDVARIVRGQILGLRSLEYVVATKSMGFKTARIIVRHLLPNLVGPLIVIVASNFAAAILLEAGLSFLGLGVERPTPSWGMMLNDNRSYLIAGRPWLAIAPGICISGLVLSFFLLGNGLRDSFDVRGKSR